MVSDKKGSSGLGPVLSAVRVGVVWGVCYTVSVSRRPSSRWEPAVFILIRFNDDDGKEREKRRELDSVIRPPWVPPDDASGIQWVYTVPGPTQGSIEQNYTSLDNPESCPTGSEEIIFHKSWMIEVKMGRYTTAGCTDIRAPARPAGLLPPWSGC